MLLQPVVDVVVVASHGAVAFARCRSAAHSGNPSESRDRVLPFCARACILQVKHPTTCTGNYLSRHIYHRGKISARLTTVPSTLRRPNGTQRRAHHRHRTRDPGHARATRAATSFHNKRIRIELGRSQTTNAERIALAPVPQTCAALGAALSYRTPPPCSRDLRLQGRQST